MILSIDQIGQRHSFRKTPSRIVSLVPSQTELLYDLGLNEEVKGITKFCVHPEEWFRKKTRVGGTKKLDIEKIRSLNPDLIIANKEENEEGQIKILAKEFPIWVSDIKNLDDALQMIEEVSVLTGKKANGDNISQKIRDLFSKLPPSKERISCAYLIWQKPFMTVGGDTFISDMLERSGFKNVFADRKRYPEFTSEELTERRPRVILLASEPYPFGEKNLIELKRIFIEANIFLVDGEMFSWYGSRLLKSPSYFSELILKIKSAL